MDKSFQLVQIIFMNSVIIILNAILAKVYGLDLDRHFADAMRHSEYTAKLLAEETDKIRNSL